MLIIIREHKTGSLNILRPVKGESATETVERWQADHNRLRDKRRNPVSITWKLSKATDIVGAMIEGARL